MRRTKATLIYRRTKNLRAVQLLLGRSKLDYVPGRTMSCSPLNRAWDDGGALLDIVGPRLQALEKRPTACRLAGSAPACRPREGQRAFVGTLQDCLLAGWIPGIEDCYVQP
jgi:hypothetical protein